LIRVLLSGASRELLQSPKVPEASGDAVPSGARLVHHPNSSHTNALLRTTARADAAADRAWSHWGPTNTTHTPDPRHNERTPVRDRSVNPASPDPGADAPRKRGRPARPPDQRRTVTIGARVTARELAEAQQVAQAELRSLHSLVRVSLLEYVRARLRPRTK
jgi:hypothetical protein